MVEFVAFDSVFSYVGTFIVATVVYAVTVHLAALYVVGDVTPSDALLIGPVPAAVLMVVGAVSVPAAAVAALIADFAAIRGVYELDVKLAAATTAVHFAISVLLIWNVLGLLGAL